MNAAVPTPDRADLARRHLELQSAAVIAGVLRLLDDASARGILTPVEVERQFPFLAAARDHLAELAGGARERYDPDLFHRLAADVAARAQPPPPLARLAAFVESATPEGDGILAADVVAAAALVERDVRFGAVFASLQAPNDVRRPCVGLLAMLFQRDADEIAGLASRLVDAGILTVENPDDLRAEQAIRVPPDLLLVIEGGSPPGVDLSSADSAPAIDDLVLDDELRERIARAATLLEAGDLVALVVRGPTGSGRRTVLRAVAGRLGRDLLVAPHSTEARGAAPGAIAMLTGALLAWTAEPGLGQLVEIPRPVDGAPLGVVMGQRGGVRVNGGERVAVIALPTPGPDARHRFWTGAGLRADDGVLDAVSQQFVLSGGTIGRVASLATAIAQLDGRDTVEAADVRQAAQDQGRQHLESLAELLPPLSGDFAPVLGPAAGERYEALVLRSRYRERLPDAIGGAAGRQITRGVRAMLSGPSGTGKTLTARALGARLDLDVYRADLAALVDKYIGETERRLDELFSRAEELDVVLLIDEGDALMTRRTDVRSSNDRYANLETDYLLQRLETFQGIVLITTNAPHLVDTAFQRRLDVTIPFDLPGPSERLRIWRQHLPAEHAVTDVALANVATACRLTGGQIRNAAVHAALLALAGERPIGDEALTAAVERELTTAGRSSPLVAPTVEASPYQRAVAAP
jgi:hypothetical protein